MTIALDRYGNPTPTTSTTIAVGAALDVSLLSLLAVYRSSTATMSVSSTVTTVSVKLVSANPDRKGLMIYNNSANSIYIAFAATANSNTNMTFLIPTFATWSMAFPIYAGQISGIRNAGTGTCLITELT